jgi:hypothetical protein
VLDAVSSPLTRVMYGHAIDEFFRWWEDQAGPTFLRATVQKYRAHLEARGLAPGLGPWFQNWAYRFRRRAGSERRFMSAHRHYKGHRGIAGRVYQPGPQDRTRLHSHPTQDKGDRINHRHHPPHPRLGSYK